MTVIDSNNVCGEICASIVAKKHRKFVLKEQNVIQYN